METAMVKSASWRKKRRLEGIVVSDKMNKTIVVRVEKLKTHPKYKRRFKSHTKYLAHSQGKEFRIGDRVVIEESRPLSKRKRWKVLSKETK
jgi:small subunit ribosomal protein S17